MYFVLESAKLVQGSAQADQVCFARQPVVAIFDQDDQNLAAVEAFSEGDAGLPWHRFIAHAVKEPHRAVQCDWPGHYQVPLAVLKELAAKRVTGRVVFGGQSDRSGVLQRALLRLGEAGPEEGLSEIRRRSDPHPPMLDPTRICRPFVSESRTAIASSVQRPIVPSVASPLEAPWPK